MCENNFKLRKEIINKDRLKNFVAYEENVNNSLRVHNNKTIEGLLSQSATLVFTNEHAERTLPSLKRRFYLQVQFEVS